MDSKKKRGKITASVIGCGTTGLLTACLLAESGVKTLIADSDHVLANLIKKVKPSSSGREVTRLVKKYVKSGSLTVTNNVKEAVSISSVIIIVNSPLVDDKKKPDYTLLEKASKEIGSGLQPSSLVLVEGNVGPGATEAIVKESLQKASGLKAGTNFSLTFSPMSVAYDNFKTFTSFPRIIGASDKSSLDAVSAFLKSTLKSPIIAVKSIRTAEAIGMLKSVQEDVNHALSLEFAQFSEKGGLDFAECQKILSPYVSSLPAQNVARKYSSPEAYLLLTEAENSGSPLRLAEQARKINEEMLRHVFQMVKESLKSTDKVFRKARITVLGISERADHEILDCSFSRDLVSSLIKSGARVRVYDPLFSVKELTDLGFQAESTFGKSIEGADCLLVAVGHERFKRLNLKRIGFLMRQPAAIVDVSNVVDPERAVKEGFVYRGLGRG